MLGILPEAMGRSSTRSRYECLVRRMSQYHNGIKFAFALPGWVVWQKNGYLVMQIGLSKSQKLTSYVNSTITIKKLNKSLKISKFPFGPLNYKLY